MPDDRSLATKLFHLAAHNSGHEARSAAERWHRLTTERILPLAYRIREGAQVVVRHPRSGKAIRVSLREAVPLLETQRLRGSNSLLTGLVVFEKAGWLVFARATDVDIEEA